MSLTPQQLAERAGYIGASDVPVIVMGDYYPWKNSTNLKTMFLEKTGRKPPSPGNVATDAGDIMEYSLLYFANSRISRLKRDGKGAIIRNEEISHPNGVMKCHLDGTFVDIPFICELKSAGQTNPHYDKERWGRSETTITSPNQCSPVIRFNLGKPVFGPGVIPLEYFWQAQAQISCVNAAARENPDTARSVIGCILVVSLPGTGQPFRYYRIMAHEESIAHLEDAVCNFNDHNLVTDMAPEAPLTSSALDEITLDENQQGSVTNETMDALQQAWTAHSNAKAAAKAAEEVLDNAIARVYDEGGPFGAMASPDGRWVLRRTSTVNSKSAANPFDRTTTKYSWNQQS